MSRSSKLPSLNHHCQNSLAPYPVLYDLLIVKQYVQILMITLSLHINSVCPLFQGSQPGPEEKMRLHCGGSDSHMHRRAHVHSGHQGDQRKNDSYYIPSQSCGLALNDATNSVSLLFV